VARHLLVFALVSFLGAACATAADQPGGDEADFRSAPPKQQETDKNASTSKVRIVAGNVTTGKKQKYDEGEGIRILQALKPDVALLQEVNYLSNSRADIQAFSTKALGAEFTYFREDGQQIPNAVFSRFPIEASGRWADALAPNRGFVWAKIKLPNDHALWAVSVHLLTANDTTRANEAAAIVTELKKVAAPTDFIVVGGDFNTQVREEPCIKTFSELLDTNAPHPSDQAGNEGTNALRTKPYDWVLVNGPLKEKQIPTTIGSAKRDSGFVFDTRTFSPITEALPAISTDSAGENMQHMAVVKDFAL
jgi:endonuclease/exonuclease/phosphatase family metal-dependent hydrolase